MNRIPELLLPWYAQYRRELPWRRDREPYHVWLSEIMLQQTRVEAVKGYYSRFLETLPDIESLANAPEELCHKLWEGLGYYSRVRNLQKGAKQVMERYGGVFPSNYEEIRQICGIGDYTAGAIASICFEQPTPAVDGNVVRVMTRVLADDRPGNSLALRRQLHTILQEIYPRNACGDFTQALMELGATVCVPNGKPRCENCPISSVCKAKKQGNPTDFPVKIKKKPRKAEDRTVWILCCHGKYALSKRPTSGLLAGLWEFPNLPGHRSVEQAIAQAEVWEVHPLSPVKMVEKEHVFTHIQWKLRGIYVECSAMPELFTWATAEEIQKEFALPTAFRQFME